MGCVLLRNRYKAFFLFCVYLLAVLFLTRVIYIAYQECDAPLVGQELILDNTQYQDHDDTSIMGRLLYRISAQPFNLFSLLIFILAITHTFFAPMINALSERLRERNIEKGLEVVDTFSVEVLRFMGEVEVIFGIWVIPLLIVMANFYNWCTAVDYISTRAYTEPLFVVVIMALASTRPILRLAEDCLKFIARFGGESVQAWWWTILTIGPISGSFITEPGAMTISALLLAKQFYHYKPSNKLAYASLALLFVNVSVGGVLTSFAAPPVLMISKLWAWTSSFMLFNFGWKAVIGILAANTLYFFLFRKELSELNEKRKRYLSEKAIAHKPRPIPFWVSLVHIAFLAWIVVHSHYPVIFIGSFLIFIGFHRATLPHQNNLSLKTPVLVGFFLAGLIVHGKLQSWWITPVLDGVSQEVLMTLSTVLTAFNDNALITFLAGQISDFTPEMKYAVVAGAVTGGGLTVIANAPNPLGQALLSKYFHYGIRPLYLLGAALPPTLIMAAAFYLLRNFH